MDQEGIWVSTTARLYKAGVKGRREGRDDID